MSQDEDITYFARINHRNAGTPFGIRQRDRRTHFYVIGKTGTGKSSLLRTMISQDVAAGRGCALLDPHGDLVSQVRAFVPSDRRSDVIDLNVPDPDLAWHFNPFAGVEHESRSLAAAGLVEVFKKLWPDDWGPRLEHLLRNVVYTLLETEGATLADVPALLTDRTYRNDVVSQIDNPVVRDFWFNEFDKYSPGFRSVVVAPLQNKVGALLTDPVLRRILTEPGRSLNLRRIMDEGRILLVNLDKGRIGEGPAALLGSFLVSHIALAGIARSEQPEAARRDFLVYLDEFQTFTTLSVANMLSELRKYRVGMILAHQHLSQLEPEVRDAVFGNAGTLVCFRVGAADAAYIAREFDPKFVASDLIGLPRYSVYLKLMIDGEPSAPFSAITLDFSSEVPPP
ncbi:MAG: type IV secretion system DNA-binding domain-containing protein [Longimicrobiales bacterium]